MSQPFTMAKIGIPQRTIGTDRGETVRTSLRRFIMKWTVCSCLVGLALLLVPQQGQALSFTVDSATVAVGTTFSINLRVVDAINLTEWQFDLAYDPTLLKANEVTEGPFLSSSSTATTLFIPGVIDNTTGEITLVASLFSD